MMTPEVNVSKMVSARYGDNDLLKSEVECTTFAPVLTLNIITPSLSLSIFLILILTLA